MPHATNDRRIRANGRAMNLALFDFDGTITTREMFRPFLAYAASPRRLAVGQLLFAAMVVGYKLGLVPSNVIRACAVRFGFTGTDASVVREKGRRFSLDVLPGVLRNIAVQRIRWHKQQGDKVVVVSGALDVYLSHWCHQHDLEWICSELEVKDGILTGRYRGAQCVNQEKSRRVQETYDLAAFPVVYAYGDTKEDLDLLQIAHRRYFRWEEVS